MGNPQLHSIKDASNEVAWGIEDAADEAAWGVDWGEFQIGGQDANIYFPGNLMGVGSCRCADAGDCMCASVMSEGGKRRRSVWEGR